MSVVVEEPTVTIKLDLSARQREMIESAAVTQWVGAGTKTGKTIAGRAWIMQGIVQGEPCAWIGPWSSKTYEAYLGIKEMLRSLIERKMVKCNDSTMRITAINGGLMEPFTGDNPGAIFGSGFKRCVIDEASRQTERSWHAAFTTVSAAKGKMKLLFNLDYGAANWAIKNLLRVKSMSVEERMKSGEDYMIFPTGGEGFVSAEYIEMAKRQLPRVIFDALYNAIIPESDLSVFRNLADIFSGQPAPRGPELGHAYVAGVDLARKQNWTVITIFDASSMKFVDARRFHEIDWTQQYGRIKDLYDKWSCSSAWVDASGIGDPVVTELKKLGINVEEFLFTEKSKAQLIEQFIVACDGKEFTFTDSTQFEAHRDELTSFQTQLVGKNKDRIAFGVPEGTHDDAAFSAMLAWHAFLQGRFGPFRFGRVVDSAHLAQIDFRSM